MTVVITVWTMRAIGALSLCLLCVVGSRGKVTNVHLQMTHVATNDWNKISNPDDQSTYSKSDGLCALACQREFQNNDVCDALGYDATDGCVFGEVQNCSLVVDASAEKAMRVGLSKDRYGFQKVVGVFNLRKHPVPVDWVFGEPDCGPETVAAAIPEPLLRPFDREFKVFGHREGIMICGGNKTVNNQKDCQFWQPGDTSWSLQSPMQSSHQHGTAIRLGYDEAIAVGQNVNAATEILSNGVWTMLQRHPSKNILGKSVHFPRLVAKGTMTIYSLGGFIINNGSIPLSMVCRYDRADDKWTVLPDAPYSGTLMNCVLTFHRGREVILCFGGQPDVLAMHSLDLKTETWTDLQMDAPAGPPYYRSFLFRQGSRIFRLRGLNENNNHLNGNRLDVFNAEDDAWEAGSVVDFDNSISDYWVMFEVTVIMKK